MNKLFYFPSVQATHVKVNHGCFVGLPSMTGLTGLNRHFCIALCRELGLPVDALQPSGALLAIEGYHLHEGFKKTHKPGKTTYEAVPAAWASFTAHIALDVQATSEDAANLLAGADLGDIAAELLGDMSLCKGSLTNVKQAANLQHPRLAGLGTERERVLRLLPSASMVVCDYSHLVVAMRAAQLNLMEGLVAATLRHAQRPALYRAFFEDDDIYAHQAYLAPVMNGLMFLEDTPSGVSVRQNALGNTTPSLVSSPAFTLTRLQKAASVRIQMAEEEISAAFWKEFRDPTGFYCRAAE